MSLFGIPSIAGLLAVALAVLVYLIIDLSPLIPGSLWSMFRSSGFWILWLILCVLTLLSYGVLKTTAGVKISNAFGPELATLATIVLAVLSSLTIIQSFSLKIADAKILDVQKILEKFRVGVLANISKTNAEAESLKRMRIAKDLFALFEQDAQALREEYADVLAQTGLRSSKIASSLTECENEATVAHLSFARVLARKITQVNPERATDLVRAKRNRL
ncbi:MAG: hypothetical protein ACYDDS_02435 [Candidatus Sulfotelmatobacter sp.]|jgi:hypothetical protein